MKNRILPLGVTLVVAIVAFVLTRVIWPDLPDMAAPTSAQMPLFLIIGIAESLAFGQTNSQVPLLLIQDNFPLGMNQ